AAAEAVRVIVGRRVVGGDVVDRDASRERRSGTLITHQGLDLLSDVEQQYAIAYEFDGAFAGLPRDPPRPQEGFAHVGVHRPRLPSAARLGEGSWPVLPTNLRRSTRRPGA